MKLVASLLFTSLCFNLYAESKVHPLADWKPIKMRTFEEAVLPDKIDYYCGLCHAVPNPSVLDSRAWGSRVMMMVPLLEEMKISLPKGIPQSWIQYYRNHSPKKLAKLPYLRQKDPLGFEAQSIGFPVDLSDPKKFREKAPLVCHIKVTDLDGDKQKDILICDGRANTLSWLRPTKSGWEEKVLAEVKVPVHSEVFDFEGDGDMDILVTEVGLLDRPRDVLSGGIVLLLNDGEMNFKKRQLYSKGPRASDARPVDLDGDGDLDILIAFFGWRTTGEVGWLEQTSKGVFSYSRISHLNGCIHVSAGDFDGDGKMDFAAIFAQQHEKVSLFIGQGDGRFEEEVIFEAGNPLFGSSGMDVVDLDQDGDLDILFSNGDGLDASGAKPYHGVQWLENLGQLKFAYHDIIRFYGVYRAVASDLDQDGDLDIVAVSQCNDWSDKKRKSLIWLRNDGKQNFTALAIASNPTHLGSMDVGDFDGDGTPEIVTGGLHFMPSYKKMSRVTLWRQSLKKK